MKWILLVLFIPLAFFAVVFLLGMIGAATGGSDKKRRARALVSLSQMTEEQRVVLKNIYFAYKAGNIEKTNEMSQQIPTETLDFLLGFFGYDNRPAEYSSGNAGKLVWLNFENKLKNQGYSGVVSKIIPGIIMDNYNEVLDKMVDNRNR